MDRFEGTYTDSRGTEAIVLTNDGTTIRTTIRGLEFAGPELEALRPQPPGADAQDRVALWRGALCHCRIRWVMPLAIQHENELRRGTLDVEIVLGAGAADGGLDDLALRLTLRYDGATFASTSRKDFFEDQLNSIQDQLPPGIYIKACINCNFSDYSPYGSTTFGGMLCFRNIKDEYVKVTCKNELWAVHDRFERQVQETYLCPEFQRRIPGTGYRG